MNENNFRERLKDIILKNKAGFTCDNKLNFVNKKSGYVVSLSNNKEKDINVLIDKALILYQSFKGLSRYKLYFGGWYDSNDNNFYLDISIIINQKKDNLAFILAKNQNQKAIFNFKTMGCLNVK